jgi:predicted esterase
MTDVAVVAPVSPWRDRLIVAGGVLAATAIVTWGVSRVVRSRTSVPTGPTDCSLVGAGGGQLAGFRYLEQVTPGADPGDALPMVILFHSRGSRPEGHAGMLYKSLGQPVRMLLPEGPNVLGNARSWTTQASKTKDQQAWAAELEQLGDNLASFIDQAVACRPTVGDPIVTGSSEGGHVAYLMASRHPELVRGAVAVAGYLPESLWSADMAPTVGLHGEKDTAVPFERTERYWQTMAERNAPIRTQSFPDVGHSVPSSVSRAWRDAVSSML